MAILTGLVLVGWGVVSLFVDLPLVYKCAAPIEIIVGLGVMVMGIGGTDYTPRPQPQGDPGARPATWEDARTCAMEAEQLDHEMGRLEVDHYGVVKGLTKSVRDVKDQDGEVIRQVVRLRG